MNTTWKCRLTVMFMNPVFRTGGLSAITRFIQSISSALTFNHNSSYSFFSSSKNRVFPFKKSAPHKVQHCTSVVWDSPPVRCTWGFTVCFKKSTWQYSLSGPANKNIQEEWGLFPVYNLHRAGICAPYRSGNLSHCCCCCRLPPPCCCTASAAPL